MHIQEIQLLIKNIECYEAHILENDNFEIIKRESLLEHTKLTLKYFEYIWDEKRIEEMLDRFWTQTWRDITESAKNFLKELIFGIPVFHDLGKINPEFQNRKMQNYQIKNNNVFSCVGGKHSIISAILYLDYFLDKLKKTNLENKEKRRLRQFLIFHSYIIERHHSDLIEFSEFLESLEQGRGRDIVKIFSDKLCDTSVKEFSLNQKKLQRLVKEQYKQFLETHDYGESAAIYVYVKMLYSLLVASDYYATTEFMSGVQVRQLGSINDIKKWIDVYENTKLIKKIRLYQKEEYPQDEKKLKYETNINRLRTEMFCDAENTLRKHPLDNLFYLEAPTGSGKSNTALNLSFQMMRNDERLQKIYYIYPFNTLVEQNKESLQKIFGSKSEIFKNIAVVNSLTPIKMDREKKEKEGQSEQTMYYQKALLDRQFLNYPMILSTHVSLFDSMFGDTKESAFGFHQLMNSVIVLDEIQSYKNTIWAEIIYFLKEFSYLLNIKIIIMSATLPNLDILSSDSYKAITLIENTKKYFFNPCFKERVHLSYELLESENNEDILLKHVKCSATKNKKILIEFIKKDTAYRFYKKLCKDEAITCKVEYMSGDDSITERGRILNTIKKVDSIILVCTQVIEAGVDIDMDIGYKNISKLDSEEQFLGRINRSCLRDGVVYFFKIDDGRKIYNGDIRIEKEFTLENEEMREDLINKNFGRYYEIILGVLKDNFNEQIGEIGLKDFFEQDVRTLKWSYVKERMNLISEDYWSMSVYLARVLKDEDGNRIDGKQVWKNYINLLKDFDMDYSQKRVELSEVVSQMNYFIYQIKRNPDLMYNDKVGEIFYIEDGEQYFENGKLNRQKLQGEIGEFIDFV